MLWVDASILVTGVFMLGMIDYLLTRFSQSTVYILVFCSLLLTGGCKSVSEKVEEHLGQHDFASARLLLEAEGAGNVPLPDVDEEILAVRSEYSSGDFHLLNSVG